MKNFRNLTNEEILRIEKQGCRSDDWNKIFVAQEFNTDTVFNSTFTGTVYLGKYSDRKSVV